MNIAEYRKKLNEIKNEYIVKRGTLYEEYALLNNHVKKGDIVIDKRGPIEVTSIRVYVNYEGTPACEYIGVELCKNNKPKKKGAKRSVWQSDDMTHIVTE